MIKLLDRDLFHHRIRLVSLSLTDFRGFGNLKLDFGHEAPISVLIANNGSGKTSVLDSVADFLRYVLAKGILGGDNEKNVFENGYKSLFTSKDIKNNEAVALCEVRLQLTYKYPAKELFEAVRDISSYLNDYQIMGKKAMLKLFGEVAKEEWMLVIDENEAPIELPSVILLHLNELVKNDEDGQSRLRSEDEFDVAFFINDTWHPNMQISSADIAKVGYTGMLHIQYELNKSESQFIIPNKKADDINGFISQIEGEIPFLEDFFESANAYANEDSKTILPLLAYYGGAAIHTKFGEVSISYTPLPYQAYRGALEPERFNFEEFLEWFNALTEEPAHKIELVRDSILGVLNAGQEPDELIYSNLRIEKGSLYLDKRVSKDVVPLPIEISQLSAGEKNLFALIGDLVKRGVQLNPVLFELDYDPEQGTYGNPLLYTYGVVLIDEIDLHLHPKWQRQIVPKLRKLFPQVQFVVTTHSPMVLQEVDGSIINLSNSIVDQPQLLGGWSIEQILQFMGVEEDYGSKYGGLVDDFYASIRDNNIEKAEALFQEIERFLPAISPFKTTLNNRLTALKEDW